MAVQPLSSATDRRLGRPLPHQLSNQTRVHLYAIALWCILHAKNTYYAVLAQVSLCYSTRIGRLLTRYSPVRHWSGGRSPRHRSTWMCYARRQRSSWARIKLSKKLYLHSSRCLNHFSKLDLLLLKLLVSSIFFLNLKEFRVSVFCTLVLYFLISFIVQFSRIFFLKTGYARFECPVDSPFVLHFIWVSSEHQTFILRFCFAPVFSNVLCYYITRNPLCQVLF